MTRFLAYSLVLFLLAGCGADEKQKVVSAIEDALYYLTHGTPQCQKAIDALEKIGRQDKDPRYLQVLASAYACRAQFSELALIDDVDKVDADVEKIFGSLASLTLAAETAPESARFQDLQRAINVLLYAGGRSTPSAAGMLGIFGRRHANNMNLQALYMILVQLGRYARWYARTDALGKKGNATGVQVNACFLNYTGGPLAVATAFGAPNACTGAGQGSSDLNPASVGATVARRRLCQGAMLLTNFLDILDNITFADTDTLGELTDLSGLFATAVAALEAMHPDMSAFLAVRDQTACEAFVDPNPEVAHYLFASLFEGGTP